MRLPLTGPAVNLAGKPSQVGGTLTRAFGWLTLVGGVSVGLLVLFVLWAALPTPGLGFAIGVPIALASVAFGLLLLSSGGALRRTGAHAEREARVRAALALATHQGGVVRAVELARGAQLSLHDADELLTSLAKTEPERWAVELDPQGELYFRLLGPLVRVDARVARPRVDGGSMEPEGEAPWEQREEPPRGSARRRP